MKPRALLMEAMLLAACSGVMPPEREAYVGTWRADTFQVSRPPTLESGRWKMVVDGVALESSEACTS